MATGPLDIGSFRNALAGFKDPETGRSIHDFEQLVVEELTPDRARLKLERLGELKSHRQRQFPERRLLRLLDRNRDIDPIARLDVVGNGV